MVKKIYAFLAYKSYENPEKIIEGTFEILSMDEHFITFRTESGNVISINKSDVLKIKTKGTYVLENLQYNSIYRTDYNQDKNLKRLRR